MTTRRFLIALVAVGMLMTPGAYGADSDTDKPAKPAFDDISEGDTPIDPRATLTLSVMDDAGAMAPLVVNPAGTALMRADAGSGPTTLGIVEGSRVAIPRAADGSCPEVEVGLSDNMSTPMAVFDDPTRPFRFKAAVLRSDIQHAIDGATCEVVITRARGYVKYRVKVVKRHPSGQLRQALPELFADPIDPNIELPTPTPGLNARDAAAPPTGAPASHPAWRATIMGTIEPVPADPEPRSHRGSRRFNTATTPTMASG
jgi:hypothetical protein